MLADDVVVELELMGDNFGVLGELAVPILG